MKYLKDLWDESMAQAWASDPHELLRYRSNLLGADLRLTNFGGGNTSSKFELPDPFTGKPVRVLGVKGSGGDLGTATKSGFALLYLDRFDDLRRIYRGRDHEDEMVAYYALATLGAGSVAPSIDTPLHALLPFEHVDHLHPDWAIALAAAANGKVKMEEFNARFHHRLVWLPWQRPGFDLGLRLREAVDTHPGCDGIILGGHGIFTWGDTSRQCYLNSLKMIDDLGQFVLEHEHRRGDAIFGGRRYTRRTDAREIAAEILPYLRGKLTTGRRTIAHYNDSDEVMQLVNSHDAEPLSRLGTSCPDHFVRTRIRPLYIDWNPEREFVEKLKERIAEGAENYRKEYLAYYQQFAQPDSPPLRDANPGVVLIPGVGMFTFAKSKAEARITGEFYVNAIHVMAGATSLGEGAPPPVPLPQAVGLEDSPQFASYDNYVALPLLQAFRIEYWILEEAKLRRQPAEKELSRRIFLVVGAGNGIGRNTVLRLAERGAHLMAADLDAEAAEETAQQAASVAGKEAVASCAMDLADRSSVAAAVHETVMRFGGLDGLINTAAIFIPADSHTHMSDDLWRRTFEINVAGNYRLVDEARAVLHAQGLSAAIVLTSSANAVVPKGGTEAYDISKSAVSHLVRELAVGLAPLVRVNGVSPATVVEGSTMFPRQRVILSLTKYGIAFDEAESTEELRNKLAHFYAQRTLTKSSVSPVDCAEAICWLASDRAAKTTGHLIPVDGGLVEAFLR
jgi:rhamnose utilization protein RhaD (predicted bifunctional aldolase and dehydrogenase)/NAD(P)-dependent dehydrogenase (short-subunit alcohol dehydrogenase family)